jgi:flavin reductase (DIM6/NTAB) family NADH-FMN oxidoreductase RutF
VVKIFATKSDDKFAGLDWAPGPFGSPLFARSSAQIEVEIRERLQTSTHTLFVCRVLRRETAPLEAAIDTMIEHLTGLGAR